jgi:protein phosphatase
MNNCDCPTFVLECAHLSDLGMRRLNNQDALAVRKAEDLATWSSRGHLFMVADGMGAHAAGELASKLAADNIPHTYDKLRDLYPPAALRQAIRDANQMIHAKGQSNIGFQGMGTTCSCLVLLPQGALVAHIGDSRVYRLRGNLIEQLTFDHSLVWEMAAAGQVPQEEVPAYIPKNVITRSLGPHPTVNLDLEGPFNAATGDVFLLCSDGLSGQVADEELGAILQCMPPEEAVQTLVDLANLRGGPDNISVIAARVMSNGEPIADEGERAPHRTTGAGWMAALVWVAIGLSLGLLAFCLMNRFWNGAIASSVALVGAIVSAVVSRRGTSTSCPPTRPIGGPYGNGPYRKTACEPNRKVVDTLADVAAKVRELPDREPGDWKIDWHAFDARRSKAQSAADREDFAEAIRQYGQAIREIMRQLREHRSPGETGSFDGPAC